MIKVTREPLPSEIQEKIKAWLNHEDRVLLENYVRGQIAQQQIEGTEHTLGKPLETLITQDVSPACKKHIMAAATLRWFLDALDELGKRAVFEDVKITIA